MLNLQTHNRTHKYTHTHSQRRTHTETHTLSLCRQSQPPSWRTSPPDTGLGALTCHGCGLPAAETALSRAQPPLLPGTIQFRTRCEGTFHLSVLEENPGTQATEGSSSALGHLRAEEEAGRWPSPSKKRQRISRDGGGGGREHVLRCPNVGPGVSACPGHSPSASSLPFCNSHLLSPPCALTLQPQNVLVHQRDLTAPPPKPVRSSAKARALSPSLRERL